MKKFVLTVLAVAALVAPAAGQVGDVSSYSDAAGTDCNVADAAPGLLTVYLFHKHATGGVTGSEFKVEEINGSTLGFGGFSAAVDVIALGNIRTDMSFGYGPCRSGDVYLGAITYLAFGTSAPCSRIIISPGASTPIPNEVVAVDCAFANVVCAHGQAIINPDVSCPCTVATAVTTWGGIKAMYR